MSEPKTHFEQIPVETVKKIATMLPAQGFPQDSAIDDDTVENETKNTVTPADERWREVAQKVQHEADPEKLFALVQELIATFDDEHKRPPHRRYPAKLAGASGQSQSRDAS